MRGVSASVALALHVARSAPVAPLLSGVLIGQGVAWGTPEFFLFGCLVIIGLLILVHPRRVAKVVWGFSLGVIPCLLTVLNRPHPLSASDAQLLVRLIEPPSRRAPGEISFIAKEVGGMQHTIRCRAVDLPWRNASELSQGDLVWVRGKITPVVRTMNPFTYEASMWRRGIEGDMKVLFTSGVLERGDVLIDRVRDSVSQRVISMSQEERGAALLLSMAFGFEDRISRTVEDLFKEVGLSHLLVVSGYQVSLVFALVYSIVTRIISIGISGIWVRQAAATFALITSGLYVILVGVDMSPIRAFIAAACACSALLLDRRPRFFQGIGVALLVMNLFWPWAIFDLGVTLTFAALCGIGLGRICGEGRNIATLIWINFAVWVLTTLVLLLWGGGIAPTSIVANILLAGPWSVLNCTVGVFGVGLSLVSADLGAPAVQLVAWVNELVVSSLLAYSGRLGFISEIHGAVRGSLILGLFIIAVGLVLTAVRREESCDELYLIR